MEIGMFAFVVALLAAWAFWASRHWFYNCETFKKVFGFEPPSPEDGLDTIEKAQQKVDHKLRILAEDYTEADLHERKVAKAVKEAQSPLKAKTLKIYLSLARQALREAKARFWRAHRLAEAFGFAVKPKYTDYLSDKMRRKVLGLPQPQRGGHGSA